MDRTEIIETRRYYGHIQVWPSIPAKLKLDAWLANFNQKQEPYAIALLEAFLYFNEALTDKLFTSAFHNLSSMQAAQNADYQTRRFSWQRFLARVLVTHPTGERPNVTDSGYMFDRKARQLLNIDESQIMHPEQVLEVLSRQGSRPVVFVDDFAGSGDQFIETWQRPYDLLSGDIESFATLTAKTIGVNAYYTPAICTERALKAIAKTAPTVHVRPAHLMTSAYDAGHSKTQIFPPSLVPGARKFILETSAGAGLPESEAFGYKKLGLALAFSHSVPDATLPIFWVDTPGWTPLLRRR